MTNESASYESLAPYYQAARDEAAQHQEFVSLEQLKKLIEDRTETSASLVEAIANEPEVAVIAEYKRRSPSKGEISSRDIPWTLEQYERGGASGISMLTQGAHFGGYIRDLAKAHEVTSLPLLRKDFIDSPYQLYQAKAYGAAAVLLIAAGLKDSQLQDLQEEARSIGLDCLVEIHDERELCRVLPIAPSLIGINNRNLSTLEEDISITRDLIEVVPKETLVVAASAYHVNNADHIRELRRLKVDAVLMGESLMREPKPAKALAKWLATDRAG